MENKTIPIGYFNLEEPHGRNELCPCKSGKKYKNCHLRKVDYAKRIINAHSVLVNKKLVDIAKKMGFDQNGKNGWQFHVKTEGSIITYSFAGTDYLRINYHDLPMVFDNVFHADKIVESDIGAIEYTEWPNINIGGSDVEKTDV